MIKDVPVRMCDFGSYQLYVLLFECHADRLEWSEGLTAVADAFECTPPENQVRWYM